MTILQKTKGVCHAVIRFFTVLFFWQIPQFAYLYCKFYLYDFELYPDVARQVGVICTVVAMLPFIRECAMPPFAIRLCGRSFMLWKNALKRCRSGCGFS